MRGARSLAARVGQAPAPTLAVAAFLAAGITGSCASSKTALLPTPPLEDVLRAATSAPHWPPGQALVLEGPARISGAEGSFRLELHGPTSFRLELRGPFTRVSASDGRVVWTRDEEGPARRLVLLERDALTLFVQTIAGGWRSHEAPQSRTLLRADDETLFLAVDYPGEAPALGLELERSSGDPRRMVSVNRGRESRWRFEGWHEGAGRRLPRTIAFEGNERTGTRLEVSTSRWEAADERRLARPSGAQDARFDPAASDRVEARRSEEGHLFVPISLDDGPPRWFLLDTGASGIVIDDDVARELSLETIGVVGAVGGAGRTFSRLARARSLQVGPLTIERPLLLTIDLGGFEAHLDVELQGILGWDLFARAAVELPPAGAAASVRIRPPGGFDSQEIPWVPALANDAVTVVRGSVESRLEGWFLLDTGAAWTAAIHTPWLSRLGLPGDRPVTAGSVRGIVGGARTLAVTLDHLELAGQVLQAPVAHLAQARNGTLADRVTLGNIGTSALMPFTVMIDLANERMALRAGALPPAGGELGGE